MRADAAQVHSFTGLAPSVALHIPWDKVDDYAALLPDDRRHAVVARHAFTFAQFIAAAAARGYRAEYPSFRYAYRGRPTPFTSTEFMTPDGCGVEVVSAVGRVGPHAYYKAPCPSHD